MRRYGTWAGDPEGRPERERDCVVEVFPNDRFPHTYQCNRRRGHGPNGEYCKQHARMVEEGRHVMVPKDA